MNIPINIQKNLLWVSKAQSKDRTRPHINHCYYDGTFFVAADGYRLHMYKVNLNIKPNKYYDNHLNLINHINYDENTYPDFKKIIPKKKLQDILDIKKATRHMRGYDRKYIYRIKIFNRDAAFYIDQLDELLDGANNVEIYADITPSPVTSKTIAIKLSDNKLALIRPTPYY